MTDDEKRAAISKLSDALLSHLTFQPPTIRDVRRLTEAAGNAQKEKKG